MKKEAKIIDKGLHVTINSEKEYIDLILKMIENQRKIISLYENYQNTLTEKENLYTNFLKHLTAELIQYDDNEKMGIDYKLNSKLLTKSIISMMNDVLIKIQEQTEAWDKQCEKCI